MITHRMTISQRDLFQKLKSISNNTREKTNNDENTAQQMEDHLQMIELVAMPHRSATPALSIGSIVQGEHSKSSGSAGSSFTSLVESELILMEKLEKNVNMQMEKKEDENDVDNNDTVDDLLNDCVDEDSSEIP
eukprot:UN10583